MVTFLAKIGFLVAETTDTTSTGGGGSSFLGGSGPTLLIYAVIFIAIFYFLLVRPGQKQRRAHQDLVSSIQKGHEVMTAGGIFGKVVSVKEDYVVVEIAKKTEIRVSRNSIARVLSDTQTDALDAEEELPESETPETLETPEKKDSESGGGTEA